MLYVAEIFFQPLSITLTPCANVIDDLLVKFWGDFLPFGKCGSFVASPVFREGFPKFSKTRGVFFISCI